MASMSGDAPVDQQMPQTIYDPQKDLYYFTAPGGQKVYVSPENYQGQAQGTGGGKVGSPSQGGAMHNASTWDPLKGQWVSGGLDWMVIAGLAVCCSGVFIAQASATSFVGTAAKHNRALALGLYVTFYYTGGSFGGVAPGWLWATFGWAGCVALVVAVQVAIAGVARSMYVPAPASNAS